MLSPLHSFLLVELPADEGERELPSGIFLPATASTERTDGLVLAAGPGKDWSAKLGSASEPCRSAVWGEAGDRVIFLERHFDPLPREACEPLSRRGFVRDHDVCAQLSRPDHEVLFPRNGWIQIEPDAFEDQSVIVTPDEYQRRPRSGRVLDLGEGVMLTSGPLAGIRRPINEMLGAPLLDRRVFWAASAEVIELAEDNVVTTILVHAKDILGIEDDGD